MAFFSIITIIKDDPKTIKYTGRSLAVQTDAPAFEWIIIGEPPADVMQEFEAMNPVILPMTGDPLNAGVAAATADYVWFVDAGNCLSDAYAMRDVRREMVAQLLPDFFFGVAREDGHIVGPKSFAAFKRGMITDFQTMLYRRRAIRDQVFSTGFRFASEYDFTLRFVDKVDKIGMTNRIMIDVMAAKITEEEFKAMRAEYFGIRETLLRQSVRMNKWIDRLTALKHSLKMTFPKIYWAGRSCFVPYERDRRASPIKSNRRAIFFKKKI